MDTWTKIANDTISHSDFTHDVVIRVDGDFATSSGLDDYTNRLTDILNLVERATASGDNSGLSELIDELRNAAEVGRYDGGIMMRAAYELERLLLLSAMNRTKHSIPSHLVGKPVGMGGDVFDDNAFIEEMHHRESQIHEIKKSQLLSDIEGEDKS